MSAAEAGRKERRRMRLVTAYQRLECGPPRHRPSRCIQKIVSDAQRQAKATLKLHAHKGGICATKSRTIVALFSLAVTFQLRNVKPFHAIMAPIAGVIRSLFARLFCGARAPQHYMPYAFHSNGHIRLLYPGPKFTLWNRTVLVAMIFSQK